MSSYGAHVTGVSKTQEFLASLKSECPEIEIIAVDLEDWDATRNALETLEPFDYLINNAAILTPGLFMDITPTKFNQYVIVTNYAYKSCNL